MISLAGALALAAVLIGGCSERGPFECSRDEQCARGDETGFCESVGFCSFADTECPQGRRFADSAGDELAGECTGTAPCGAVGQACCEGDVCGDGITCGGQGMCVSCFSELAPGRRHTCAIGHDTTIWCWGNNDQGQLGNGNDAISGPTPVQVVGGNGAPLSGATYVASGFNHSCAVVAGKALCWGANDDGKLGDGTTDSRNAAVEVIDTGGQPLQGIVQIDVGDAHSCALASSGQVFCWGLNEGRLGDGETTTRGTASPVIVAGGEPLAGAVQLAVNGRGACVRGAGDRISCWGRNNDGETGVGNQAPVTVATEVFTGTDVATGRRHTCAATADGDAICWGGGWRGTLGNTDNATDPILVPGAVLTIDTRQPVSDVAEVAAGAAGCYRSNAGEVYCWGPGSYGQVGAGAGSYYATPVLTAPSGPPLSGATRITSHHSRVCAFLEDGRIVCWGRNIEGQLGDGSTENRAFPTEVQCP